MYPADITYPPAMIAAGVQLAVGEMRKETVEETAKRIPPHLGLSAEDLDVEPDENGQRHIKLGVHLITPENAKDYYFPDSVY
jgi:ribose transport system substrate-binding protein